MWNRIRAVIIEDEPLAAQYLAALLNDTYQVEVVGSATTSDDGLRLCAELRPDAVFVDINLPDKDGVSLATQLAMLPEPPRLVFTTGNANRATDAFRLGAVHYLLKPLDPEQVTDAVNRLLRHLRPFELGSFSSSGDHANEGSPNKTRFTSIANELLPVRDGDADKIRLLARREVAAVLRRERRTWIHTLREEFAAYYALANLTRWLGGDPFIQIGRHATVNLHAIEHIIHYGDRLYRVRLCDRMGTEIKVSRTGAAQLAAVVQDATLKRGYESRKIWVITNSIGK